MHKFLLYLSIGLALPSCLLGSESEPFEGRIVYDVDSGGMKMTYTVWFKNHQWRSELKSGAQVFDLRIGDSAEGAAYLVNEGGKSYRMIGGFGPGMRPEGGLGRKPRGDKAGKRKSPEDELMKAVVSKTETRMILDQKCKLERLKGGGSKLDIWLAEAGMELPGAALPRLKAFEGKERLFIAYFREGRGMPFLFEAGSGKKRFEMRIVCFETMSVDDSLVVLSDEYKIEGSMRSMLGVDVRRRGGPDSSRRPLGR